MGSEQQEVSGALLNLEYQQDPADISDEVSEGITGIAAPRRPSVRILPRPPPQRLLGSSGSGIEQSGSQGLALTLAETPVTEEDAARSISGHRVRYFSRGRDGRVNGDGGRVLEISRRQSLVDMQQRNTSLPLFRQRGSAGGESSAVGGIMREGLGASVPQLVVVEEEEEEEPFEGRGRGRARRRNLFSSP